jgi:Arc/MetJ-type ribon-helix-helix transcriptional regulator
MKLSVSLPVEDVEFLDEYARSKGLPSRSAVLRKAIRLLRSSWLADAYEESFRSWEEEGHHEDWDATVVDGW